MFAFAPGIACLALFGVSLAARARDASTTLFLARAASTLAFGSAVAAAAWLWFASPATSPLIGAAGLGISFRIDHLSVILAILISFVGLLVIEYSRRYLAGSERQAEFIGRLSATVAAAMLMATAGNLLQLVVGWVAMSLALHGLLLFFRERPRARVAAHKKFLVARLGDACLATAMCLLWTGTGTGDIATILDTFKADNGIPSGSAAAWLIAAAAILKSAQFPTHGWITEVMETPTPVSALLHAGIVNAGGFLIIRFADVVVTAPGAMQLLVAVGGFTALFGSLVMTTQNSVKVQLAYSTVAQMGFMLLQCGFGAFSSAALHLVAHSLYKAHSFLASGNAVEQVRLRRSTETDQRPGIPALFASLLIALACFTGIGMLFEHPITSSPAVLTLGACFIMGLFIFLARGATSGDLLLRIVPGALAAAAVYFSLQVGAAAYFAPLLPDPPAVDAFGKGLAALVIVSFALVSLHQVLGGPDRASSYRRFYVTVRNGLYANALFNRFTGAIKS